MPRSRLLVLLVPFLVACTREPPTPVEPEPDAGVTVEEDAGVDGGMDAGVDGGMDAGVDGGMDAGGEDPMDGGLPSTCEGDCRDTTLTVRVGDTELPMDRVQFGFTSPEQSPRGRWELFIEAHSGGDPDCPEQDSPSPDRTIVFSGIAVPTDATEQTRGDGLSVVLLDFRGDLTSAPVVRAETISMIPTAANLCPECLTDGGAPADQFLSFELTADFAAVDGGVRGHAHARYCESMNEL